MTQDVWPDWAPVSFESPATTRQANYAAIESLLISENKNTPFRFEQLNSVQQGQLAGWANAPQDTLASRFSDNWLRNSEEHRSRRVSHPVVLNEQPGRVEFLHYGVGLTPFGHTFISWNHQGICQLGFIHCYLDQAYCDHPEDQSLSSTLEQLLKRWPEAELSENNSLAQDLLAYLLETGTAIPVNRPIPLLLRGTAFQLQVWRALTTIPVGSLATYTDIARLVDSNGCRAVGSAIASNPIGWLIPCHRILRSDGGLGGFRWSLPRKVAMLAYERLD